MSLLEHPFELKSFDYTCVGKHAVLLRVMFDVAPGFGEHAAHTELAVHRAGSAWQVFGARAGRWEEDADAHLLWRGLFAVPAAVLDRSEFTFALRAAELPELELTTPQLRGALTLIPAGPGEEPELEVTDVSELTPTQIAGLTMTGRRTRAVALATVLAVAATSAPGQAIADAGITAITHAQVSKHKIERLASFAVRQARSQVTQGTLTPLATAAGTSPSSRAQRPSGSVTGQAPITPSSSTTTCTTPVAATLKRRHDSTPQGTLLGRTEHCVVPGPARAVKQPAAHKRTATRPRSGRAAMGTLSTPTASAPSAPTSSPPTATGPTATTPAPAGTTPAPAGTTPAPSVPSPSGGAGLGTLSPTPYPAPVLTSKPTPPPSAPPAVRSARPEHASHPQLPVILPTRSNGGSAVAKPAPPSTESGATATSGGSGLVSSPPGFLGPKSWTGTVSTDPALTNALGDLSAVLANGDTPPHFLIPIYMEAGRRFHIPWEVLAGINAVESDYGRDLSTSSAGAIGWMQFEPGTWKEYGMAVDGHRVANPYDPRDAIFSAAKYLAAAGGANNISGAIYAYNHAGWYVNMVLERARAIAATVRPVAHTGKRGVISTYFASWHGQLTDRYRGGVLSHYDRLIAAANMVSAANFPYVYGGGHEQPAQFGPFDCSGSVSYVMQQAGYKVPTTVSGDVPIWRFPAGPGRVTIFYNPTHTFLRIGNRYFGTSGFARGAGGGAGWFDTNVLPASYLATFREVHVPRLGINSFAPAPKGHHRATTRPRTHTTAPNILQRFSSTPRLAFQFPIA